MAKKPVKKPTSTPKAKEVTASAAAPAVKSKAAPKGSAFGNAFQARNFKSLSIGGTIAELLGTFAFVLVYMTVQGSQLYLFFTYVALVLIFARAAGPHFNPALTVGMWAVRRIKGINAIAFIIAQILGAMLALVVANALVPDAVNQLTGQSEPGQVFTAQPLPEGGDALWRALAVEAIGSLVLAIGAAAALLTQRGLAAKAFTLGGALMVGLLVVQGGQILNPAVALGLQALKMEVWPIAIYVLTPIAAAIVGMSLYRFMQREADAADKGDNSEVVVQRVRL